MSRELFIKLNKSNVKVLPIKDRGDPNIEKYLDDIVDCYIKLLIGENKRIVSNGTSAAYLHNVSMPNQYYVDYILSTFDDSEYLLSFDADNKFMGYMRFVPTNTITYIRERYLNKEYRRKGFYADLIRMVISIAKKNHCTAVELQYVHGNIGAREMYKEIGFKSAFINSVYII